MSVVRVPGILLVCLLVIPLSGCIGGDDDKPAPSTGETTEILEGAPPAKFTFAPLTMSPSGSATHVHETERRCTGGVDLSVNCRDDDKYYFTYKVQGLTSLGTGENGTATGEAWYSVWIGKPSGGTDDGVVWERITDGDAPAADGTLSGKTKHQVPYRSYRGVAVSIETSKDAIMEIPILKVLWDEPTYNAEGQMVYQDPLGPAFADAKVVFGDGDQVNLSVEAFELPAISGAYDLFLENEDGITWLGTLKPNEATSSHTLALTPDETLFTKYHFFISVEANDENKQEDHAGFQVLKSQFRK